MVIKPWYVRKPVWYVKKTNLSSYVEINRNLCSVKENTSDRIGRAWRQAGHVCSPAERTSPTSSGGWNGTERNGTGPRRSTADGAYLLRPRLWGPESSSAWKYMRRHIRSSLLQRVHGRGSVSMRLPCLYCTPACFCLEYSWSLYACEHLTETYCRDQIHFTLIVEVNWQSGRRCRRDARAVVVGQHERRALGYFSAEASSSSSPVSSIDSTPWFLTVGTSKVCVIQWFGLTTISFAESGWGWLKTSTETNMYGRESPRFSVFLFCCYTGAGRTWPHSFYWILRWRLPLPQWAGCAIFSVCSKCLNWLKLS
jgi:hypothetical protein